VSSRAPERAGDAGPGGAVDRWLRRDGAPSPLGATWIEAHAAYNFALYSRHATAVTLLCYRAEDPVDPVFTFPFDHRRNKTGRVWHCCLPAAALQGATHYAYRVDGPRDVAAGHRFDPQKVLLDPYAREVYFPPRYSRAACSRPGPTDGQAPLGVLPTARRPDPWGDHARPRHTWDAVIYEVHVKGFTARPGAGVGAPNRGTFAGLAEKIPYLQDLGVTVVELLPVQQFDPGEGNYWGYMTLNFFAPHRAYAAGDPADEFRDLVKAMHRAGIEVWLDVVYNHSSEFDASGPTYTFRGLDNRTYYLMGPDLGTYRNDTGCGNTLRCGHPAVRTLIMESLRHWTETMQVDGFRFDLASIFTRDQSGTVDLDDPPLIAEISSFADRTDRRVVAEAWDVDSYQLGQAFPGFTWLQWNGKFRDDVRCAVRGDPGRIPDLMRRLYGSDDLFPDGLEHSYRPYQSVNFVTSHDGFCLYDLVSYERKRNAANGFGNRDGADENFSWNCGWEGDDGAPADVLALRRRQVKNFCALLLLANGVPMFVAGDEFMHSQGGNNNPYNQDNPTTWLDWERLERNADVHRFFKGMIAFRKAHPSICRGRYWREDVRWYGLGAETDMSWASRTLAYALRGASEDDDDLYVLINLGTSEQEFAVQEWDGGAWLRCVDTARPSPQDLVAPGEEPPLESPQYLVAAHSVVVLRRPAVARSEA
jgi:glycogen operon protein